MATNRSEGSPEYPSALNNTKIAVVIGNMLEIRSKMSQEWGVPLERSDQVVTVTTSNNSCHISSNLANCRSISASMRSRKEYNSVGNPPYGFKSAIEVCCQQSLRSDL